MAERQWSDEERQQREGGSDQRSETARLLRIIIAILLIGGLIWGAKTYRDSKDRAEKECYEKVSRALERGNLDVSC